MVDVHWENGTGTASHGGLTLQLAKRPELMAGIESLHLDIGVARIKKVGEPERHMTHEEQISLIKTVIQAANDAWDAMMGESTLAVVIGR